MKKIGIIGQFPPPIHGLSKALYTLYNSYLNDEFELTKIDITNNRKFFLNFFKIYVSKLDLYYLAISQSKWGNIRDLILIKLIQLKKKKIILHLHGGGFRNILDNEFGGFQKKINYKLLSKVDSAIVLGESLKYIFEEILPDEKILVVKNCVDNECIMSDQNFESKIKIFQKKDKLNILYLSNFIEEKGYKEVLKIAKIIRENNDKRFKFVFAGKFFDPSDYNEFTKYIDNNDLGEYISYEGIVSGEKKEKLLKNSDIFMLLTKYKNEGQPICILEAMENGLIIMTSKFKGINDIVDESSAYKYDVNKINLFKIYEDLNGIYNNRGRNISVLIKNRKKVNDEFNEMRYLQSLEKVFLDMISLGE